MKLSKIAVDNFRLLQDIELNLDDKVTVIVGRNNSGKTSLTELFKRLLDEQPRFRLEDFSIAAWEGFWTAYELFKEGKEEGTVRPELPMIRVKLCIEYTAADELQLLSDFIIDLNESCTTVHIDLSYCLPPGKIAVLLEGAFENQSDCYKAIRERVPKLFELVVEAQDPNDATNRRQVDLSVLRRTLQPGFINAQRALDDSTLKERAVLGKILENLFVAASKKKDGDEQSIAKKLDEAVSGVQGTLDKEFNDQLRGLYPTLERFGYPGLNDPGLQTQTVLNVQQLLSNHTTVGYSARDGVNLPEPYNGLGPRNLIFILLKLYEYFKQFTSGPTTPVSHLIFIEEPEAHLHPQMQSVFIRKLSEIKELFEKEYNEGRPWSVQFVVTTHSSHIANEASFDSMRYFLTRAQKEKGAPGTTIVKDLKLGLKGQDGGDREFLHKYMTLTRCDLLFADKAILVEGASERLMMPTMISKHDSGSDKNATKLGSQYLTVMEVGGAYAHIFFDLLKFLELQALVITDIDTEGADGKKCRVSEGVSSSNSTINRWFKDPANKKAPKPTKDELLAKADIDKVQGAIRLAYQIPHAQGDACGRSFEDAFILSNPTLFSLVGTQMAAKELEAWNQAKEWDKTDFALKHAIQVLKWELPKYISDGLVWLTGSASSTGLATPSSDQA